MKRRPTLRCLGLGIVPIAGCAATNSEPTAIPDDVDDPPDWLVVRGDCENTNGSLILTDRRESVSETTAVAEYERLSEESKPIVRFALHREGAETCTDAGATVFQKLLGDLTDHAVDPYTEANEVRPRSIAVNTEAGYHIVTEMYAFDQVLV